MGRVKLISMFRLLLNEGSSFTYTQKYYSFLFLSINAKIGFLAASIEFSPVPSRLGINEVVIVVVISLSSESVLCLQSVWLEFGMLLCSSLAWRVSRSVNFFIIAAKIKAIPCWSC